MKRISMALSAAGLLTLGACGGSDNQAANTTVEEVNLIEDNLLDEPLAGNVVVGNETGDALDTNIVGNEAGNTL